MNSEILAGYILLFTWLHTYEARNRDRLVLTVRQTVEKLKQKEI
jgi:hypothetical protein